MNDIVQRLMENVGLPEDKAMAAADTVLSYLKEKLPPAVSSQLDGAVGGSAESGVMSRLGEMGSRLGGMLGRNE